MFKAREYQETLSTQMVDKLQQFGIVYLAAEVRTGKTFTSLMAADKFGAKKVLFLTVKKAIKGIQEDINLYGKVDVEVLSVDSAHKAIGNYDLIIVDEAHGLGSFPKPNRRVKSIKAFSGLLPIILMSGTPHPESLCQLYHQFSISDYSPFKKYKNFYAFAKDYAAIYEMKLNGFAVKQYDRGIERMFNPIVSDYFLTFSQKEADFQCEVKEHVLFVEMHPSTMSTIAKLKEDKVVVGKKHTILADTPVKLMSKVHQMCSGTVIDEDNEYVIFDRTKAKFILKRFKGQKIAIYYKYQSELKMLQEEYGESLTTDVQEFQQTDKIIALQIRAGSTGINLSAADCQVFLNIDFSSKDWIQAKARLQTQKRESVDVYLIFSEGGIERDIFKSLDKKKDYTSRYFKNEYFK